MAILQWTKRILSLLTFKSILKKYERKAFLVKIKAAKMYVLAVKKMRLFFLAFVLLAISFLLLGSGLFLIHLGLFVYSNWSSQEKFIAALILGAVEALGAISVLYYLLREKTWVRYSGIPKVIDTVVKERSKPKT